MKPLLRQPVRCVPMVWSFLNVKSQLQRRPSIWITWKVLLLKRRVRLCKDRLPVWTLWPILVTSVRVPRCVCVVSAPSMALKNHSLYVMVISLRTLTNLISIIAILKIRSSLQRFSKSAPKTLQALKCLKMLLRQPFGVLVAPMV